jgi:hypothetical protein
MTMLEKGMPAMGAFTSSPSIQRKKLSGIAGKWSRFDKGIFTPKHLSRSVYQSWKTVSIEICVLSR